MTQNGFTALIRASEMGDLEMVEGLLAAGSDKDARDEVDGEVPGRVRGSNCVKNI